MARVKNAFTEQGPSTSLGDSLSSDFNRLTNTIIQDPFFGQPNNKYFTGSRAIIKVNDRLFGFAFNVVYNISTEANEINTIDDYTPYELAPSRISVNGAMNSFHIPGRSASAERMQADVLSFLFHRYITIEITDQATGTVIFKTNKAVITNRSQVITAGQISTVTLNWKAIGWMDDFILGPLPEKIDIKS